MTTEAKDDKPRADSPRHIYGPRPVAALVPGLTRTAFRRRAPATAQVLVDWAAIVGPALAADTTPRRLSAGTLAIACAGPVAMELQHCTPQLIDRINTHLGGVVVQRLRFVQDAQATPPPPAPPPADPAAAAAAEAAVAGFAEGPLRAALAALGRAVLTRR
ncbi:MAG TPA: DUF721 domain-containing protein [Acetobacteraceae bacterium]|nr:DUF721 domain-containing protein [Acetobacteraceae bacterium]